MKLKTFRNLSNEDVMHPWDIKASKVLSKVPGLELLTRKVMEYGFERVYYLENTADNVRVTENMFPRLHRYLQYGCKILGVEEPEMYVTMDPEPRAYTYGHSRPFIVLSSGLIDMLDEQERFFVIGHELGHIRYGHVLYTVLAENLATILELVGKANTGFWRSGDGILLDDVMAGVYGWVVMYALRKDGVHGSAAMFPGARYAVADGHGSRLEPCAALFE